MNASTSTVLSASRHTSLPPDALRQAQGTVASAWLSTSAELVEARQDIREKAQRHRRLFLLWLRVRASTSSATDKAVSELVELHPPARPRRPDPVVVEVVVPPPVSREGTLVQAIHSFLAASSQPLTTVEVAAGVGCESAAAATSLFWLRQKGAVVEVGRRPVHGRGPMVLWRVAKPLADSLN